MAIKLDWTSRKLASEFSLPASGQSTLIRDLGNCRLKELGVCLTFDDGPDPLYTPMILDILREQNIFASFFVVGEVALRFPTIIGRMADAGHSIGNHSYSHAHPWLGSAGFARWQVSRTSEILTHLAGQAPRWFRPPFGRLRKAMIDQARQEGMTTVLWNRSIIDWGWCGTESGISRRLKKIAAGDIVLLHDGKRQHNHPEILVRQLPDMLDALKQQLLPLTLDQIAR